MSNVLLIVADDLGKQQGCYGCKAIKTPNLDKLAAEGVRFTHAFASTASCSGSRSTIYTGMHTHENGQYGLNSGKHHFMTFEEIQTGPKILNDHGYLTGIIGKVHVGPKEAYPWTIRNESFTRDVRWTSNRAAEFFQESQKTKKPFVLTVAYHDPHRDQTRGGFGNDEPVDPSIKSIKYSPEEVEVPNFLNDLPGVRREIAEYYEAISRLDQGVGFLLEELENAGLADDTLVIFLSDNGPPFLNSKTTLYDAGTCLPLIVRKPGLKPSVNPNLVSYVDVLPTILDWTLSGKTPNSKGLKIAGKSFLSILGATEQLPDWDHVFGSHTFHESTMYWPTRFSRTTQYKYHRNIAWRLDFPFANDMYGSYTWEEVRNSNPKVIGKRTLKDYFFRPPEELYDLINDPEEVVNVAKDPKYAEIVNELRNRLEDWQRRTNDPWLFRDGTSVLLNKRHLDAGLKLPDKWDLDIDDLETTGEDVKFYENKPFGLVGPRS